MFTPFTLADFASFGKFFKTQISSKRQWLKSGIGTLPGMSCRGLHRAALQTAEREIEGFHAPDDNIPTPAFKLGNLLN